VTAEIVHRVCRRQYESDMLTMRILYGTIDGARDDLHWQAAIAAVEGSANCGNRSAGTRLA
jgi:hypothetical protein